MFLYTIIYQSSELRHFFVKGYFRFTSKVLREKFITSGINSLISVRINVSFKYTIMTKKSGEVFVQKEM